MKKQENLFASSDTEFKITFTQSKQNIQELFSQFKQDFSNLTTPTKAQNKNFLMTTSVIQRKVPKTKSKDKKRMKLIDYIYIKNTAKKNQHTSKVNKCGTGMSTNELKKSQIKEGKQKAFKSIVEQMVSELKQISTRALEMAEIANQHLTYSGNTDDIAKLCNIRRLLKDNMLKNIAQIQKLMGVESKAFETNSRKRLSQQQDDELSNKLKRLEAIGVQRIEQDNQIVIPIEKRLLKVQNKNSIKDTWISEALSPREDP